MDKKFYYKLELLYVKYSPMLVALGLLLNSILCYFHVYTLYYVGGYLFGVSLLTIGHMYNSSRAYRFCKYHRMFIHYIVINNILNSIDYYLKLPITSKDLLYLHGVIAGIFLFLILYYYLKYGDRENDSTNKKNIIRINRENRCW